MLVGHCKECDYKFDTNKIEAHIGTKFLLFDYAYIVCPRCWHKITISEEYYKYFGLKIEE